MGALLSASTPSINTDYVEIVSSDRAQVIRDQADHSTDSIENTAEQKKNNYDSLLPAQSPQYNPYYNIPETSAEAEEQFENGGCASDSTVTVALCNPGDTSLIGVGDSDHSVVSGDCKHMSDCTDLDLPVIIVTDSSTSAE